MQRKTKKAKVHFQNTPIKTVELMDLILRCNLCRLFTQEISP